MWWSGAQRRPVAELAESPTVRAKPVDLLEAGPVVETNGSAPVFSPRPVVDVQDDLSGTSDCQALEGFAQQALTEAAAAVARAHLYPPEHSHPAIWQTDLGLGNDLPAHTPDDQAKCVTALLLLDGQGSRRLFSRQRTPHVAPQRTRSKAGSEQSRMRNRAMANRQRFQAQAQRGGEIKRVDGPLL